MTGSGSVRLQPLTTTAEVGAAGGTDEKVQIVATGKVGVMDETEGEKEDRLGEEQSLSRQPRITRALAAPTQTQIEEHNPQHVKSDNLCPYSVAGQGVSEHHRLASDGRSRFFGDYRWDV